MSTIPARQWPVNVRTPERPSFSWPQTKASPAVFRRLCALTQLPTAPDRPALAMSDSSKGAQPSAATGDDLTLSFDGKLRDYLRVWLVSTLLTLVTAGIFLPW